MPKDFEDCVKNGGRVRTKKLKNNKYIHICYDKNGNSYSGEVMTKKKESSSFNKAAKAEREKKTIEDSKKLAESLLDLQKHFHDNFRA